MKLITVLLLIVLTACQSSDIKSTTASADSCEQILLETDKDLQTKEYQDQAGRVISYAAYGAAGVTQVSWNVFLFGGKIIMCAPIPIAVAIVAAPLYPLAGAFKQNESSGAPADPPEDRAPAYCLPGTAAIRNLKSDHLQDKAWQDTAPLRCGLVRSAYQKLKSTSTCFAKRNGKDDIDRAYQLVTSIADQSQFYDCLSGVEQKEINRMQSELVQREANSI